jgi:hypothetical protein
VPQVLLALKAKGWPHHCFILWHIDTSDGISFTVLLALVIADAAVLPVEVCSNTGAPDTGVRFVYLNNTASSRTRRWAHSEGYEVGGLLTFNKVALCAVPQQKKAPQASCHRTQCHNGVRNTVLWHTVTLNLAMLCHTECAPLLKLSWGMSDMPSSTCWHSFGRQLS